MNKSTIKTLEIIELISGSNEAMTTTEIATKLSLPMTTTYDIIKSLMEKGYVQYKNKFQKTYELVPFKILEISDRVLEKIDSDKIIKNEILKLSKEFNETVFFAKPIEDEVVYFSKIESSRSVRTTAVLGSKNPMYCTGLGKAILTTYSDEEIKKYLKRTELVKRTSYTITEPKIFLEDIKKAKKRGYAIDYREGETHLLCVAAPIMNHEEVIGAISLTGMFQDLEEEDIEKRGVTIRDTAKNISKKLGYQIN